VGQARVLPCCELVNRKLVPTPELLSGKVDWYQGIEEGEQHPRDAGALLYKQQLFNF